MVEGNWEKSLKPFMSYRDTFWFLQKGKAPTKGAKQIMLENSMTIAFYRNMSLVASCFYALIMFLSYVDITTWNIVLTIFVILIQFGCYQMMKYISKPHYGENNQLIDPGLDLNMEGGMSEHVKDIVILSSITQVLAVISNYFWFLLLLLPVRAFWLLWVNILGPWFFQPAAEDPEQDEKKRKKLERKMKRFQQ